MTHNPTIIFVPGAWHVPEHYEPVVKDLGKHGFPAFAVSLPSVGGNPPVTSFDADVDAIISAITSVVDQCNDVILVFHSYGGMPGTEAVGRIVEARRDTEKTNGKIKHLIYMSAHVPFEGHTLGTVLSEAFNGMDFGPVEKWQIPYWDYDNGLMVPNINATEYFYEDMTKDSAASAQSLLKPHAAAAFTFSKVTVAGWRFVPSTYVYTKNDKAFAVNLQEFMARRAQQEGGKDSDVNPFSGPLGEVYIDVSHCALAMDRAEKFSNVIRSIAESI